MLGSDINAEELTGDEAENGQSLPQNARYPTALLFSIHWKENKR